MPSNQEQINELLQKAAELMRKQEAFRQEIADLYSEIRRLKTSDPVPPESTGRQHAMIAETPSEKLYEVPAGVESKAQEVDEGTTPTPGSPRARVSRQRSNLEKFIGENLINKIGIAVTVIGVGIGAKYAIDHQLISPWTRIILGYLVGLGLFGFAVRLKKQYANFSAVLLSGSMAIMYFITFAAYSFYGLIPVALTFILMVTFTVFTVLAAIKYNRQVVANIGLVGAYAVPFLLDDGSGRVLILFSYMTLINTGILVIAFRKYWKSLYYSSFILTWLIFFTWYVPDYKAAEHFGLAMTFIPVFFATFYIILMAYKLLMHEKHEIEDIILLLVNSGVFYGLGYATLQSGIRSEAYTGLFTLGNALVHFGVAAAIWLRKPPDRGLLYYVLGLGLVFITMAIPAELHGHWVTLLWAGEAAVLFWIGRTKQLAVYELISFPLMFLVLFSLVNDWQAFYNAYDPRDQATRITAIFNVHFMTSLLVVISFGCIQYFNGLKARPSPLASRKMLMQIMNYAIPALLLFILYFAIFKEITNFWAQRFTDSEVTVNQGLTVARHYHNADLPRYSSITVMIYSMLFFSLLSAVNVRWIKNPVLGLFNLALNTIVLGVFLTLGLIALGELRDSYVGRELSTYYYRGGFGIAIRYFSFAAAGLLLFSIYKYVREEFVQTDFRMEFDLLLHIVLLTLACNELINWMDLYRPGQSYKLGLSILSGVYALLLVAMGIWKKKVHLRIAAIVLFAATLLKLFFYDLADLDTISKTIVFVILGVLLLIISFLYNKYKGLIFEERD